MNEEQRHDVMPPMFVEPTDEEAWQEVEATFDLDQWVETEAKKRDGCVSGKFKNHAASLKKNALNLIKAGHKDGRYPEKFMERMEYLFKKDNYQGVIDLVARFDLMHRWCDMMNDPVDIQRINDVKLRKVKEIEQLDIRGIDMENGWED